MEVCGWLQVPREHTTDVAHNNPRTACGGVGAVCKATGGMHLGQGEWRRGYKWRPVMASSGSKHTRLRTDTMNESMTTKRKVAPAAPESESREGRCA